MTSTEFSNKYTAADLRFIAETIGEKITIRSYTDGASHDDKRNSSPEEKDIISKIAYAAMLAYKHRENADIDSILDVSEYLLHQFIPDCNGYDTIYIPIRLITKTGMYK